LLSTQTAGWRSRAGRHPKTNATFFKAGPETTYWLNKWMSPDSYERYKDESDKETPIFSAHYKLKYRINGKSYEW